MPTRTLSISHRERIIAIVKDSSYREAQQKLKQQGITVSLGNISKLMNKYKATHLVKNRKRSGRPCKTSSMENYSLYRLAVANRHDELKILTNKFNNKVAHRVSRSTVSRRLQKLGFKRRPAAKNLHFQCCKKSADSIMQICIEIVRKFIGIKSYSLMRKFSDPPTTHCAC